MAIALRSSRFSFVALLFLFAAAGAVAAGETGNIEWSLREQNVTAARGETFKLTLSGKITEGWHTYTTKEYGPKSPAVFPTTVTPAPETLVKLNGAITYPKPELIKQDGVDVEVFEHTATFTLPLQVSRTATPGEHTITLTIDAQVCSDKACIPLFDKKLAFTLKVTDAIVAEAPAPPQPKAAPPPPAQKMPGGEWFGTCAEISGARERGLLAYLGFSLGMGAAALLTPCVFPMVPITVSFFTKRRNATRGAAVRDAALYALGIILTFIGLGFLFTLLRGATGITDFAANPWVNLFIAAVFVIFALSLFGAFELQLPPFILNRLNAAAQKGQGVVSVLLMGLVFSLTSFTCTVPFVGASLFTATQGDWTCPLVGMFGFATAFALPFFVLALFPALIQALPRAGSWMNSVKVVMGFLELAAAMKFLSNADLAWRWALLTREVFVSVWIALAILAAIYILGRIQFPHDTPVERVSAQRLLLATGFLAFGCWLSTGLFGQRLGELDAYVPPKPYPGQEPGVELSWLEDWDAALAEAQRSGKPLFVDFSGYTCTNCRWMESNVFPLPEITSALKDYVRVRLFTDGRKDAAEAARSRRYQALQQERFKTIALPFYAIIGPDGKDIATFPGLTRDPRAFAAFVQAGLRPGGR